MKLERGFAASWAESPQHGTKTAQCCGPVYGAPILGVNCCKLVVTHLQMWYIVVITH